MERVLQPRHKRAKDGRYILGYRCTNSRMTVAVAADHTIETDNEWTESSQIDDDLAKHVYRVRAKKNKRIRIVKMVSYHSSTGLPTRELADRCDRTLDRARADGLELAYARQRDWLDSFWARTDVEIHGQPAMQQAMRWNMFQLAQASARADGQGVAAKGVSGTGYGGHYFWDTEIYVLPVLSYTSPLAARNALRFRMSILDQSRLRAAELNQQGALFPWRTISGQESSAYYAAGTAQYHIDADISYALSQYVMATGDRDFVARGAIDIWVETARMWADLGFWRANGKDSFHIHGVTGPDEYTTVVNDNLYTNLMARSNLGAAAHAVNNLREADPGAYTSMVARLNLEEAEVEEWLRAAEKMFIPFDKALGVHPQDAQFLEKELWDLSKTPVDKRPLLLHYHPLVIYRFQVLKQADVVLALFLQGDLFTDEEKRADFDYYDPITTGDSTLSAVVQSIMAAEVGYHQLALDYFASRPVRRPRRPAPQHLGRRARRVARWHVELGGVRLRRHARPQRPHHARPAAARQLGCDHVPHHGGGLAPAGAPHAGLGAAHRRGRHRGHPHRARRQRHGHGGQSDDRSARPPGPTTVRSSHGEGHRGRAPLRRQRHHRDGPVELAAHRGEPAAPSRRLSRAETPGRMRGTSRRARPGVVHPVG